MHILAESTGDKMEEGISIRSRRCVPARCLLVDFCRPVWSNV